MLDLLLTLRRSDRALVLRSDAHPDYRRALLKHPHRNLIRAERHPNPPRGARGSPRSRQALDRVAGGQSHQGVVALAAPLPYALEGEVLPRIRRIASSG